MSAQHTPGPATSYLVAAIGATRGALVQCFARSGAQAERAVRAIALDTFRSDAECHCIDTGAPAGLWIDGDPSYIRAAIAKAKSTGSAS